MPQSFSLDPAGMFGFEIPIGFGPEAGNSTLTKVVLNHFELPGEKLEVHAVPTLARDPRASDQVWLERIRSHWPLVKWWLIPAHSKEIVAASGERLSAEGVGRYRFLRGA